MHINTEMINVSHYKDKNRVNRRTKNEQTITIQDVSYQGKNIIDAKIKTGIMKQTSFVEFYRLIKIDEISNRITSNYYSFYKKETPLYVPSNGVAIYFDIQYFEEAQVNQKMSDRIREIIEKIEFNVWLWQIQYPAQNESTHVIKSPIIS